MSFLSQAHHVHLIGIGGIGLSALARILLARGYRVSGSDPVPNRMTRELAEAGASIAEGHRAENVEGADLVIVTSAVGNANPEVQAAQARGIPILKRREFLREITEGYQVIAIAGSHGKTTTTAMIGLTLTAAGFAPTVVVGGIVPEWGTNARAGSGAYFVIEADEYDHAFLGLAPMITVVTNVDYDHPDLFPTRQEYHSAFQEFIAQTRADGVIVTCGDDETAKELAAQSNLTPVLYGLGTKNEWRAVDIAPNSLGGNDFDVDKQNRVRGRVALRVPGTHNVLNALAALVVADRVNIGFDRVAQTLGGFTGVGRRFEIRGTFNGAMVVDDYAHHPTEIRATLSAARSRFGSRPIWVLFQPHTFTRTRALIDEFAQSFGDADHVIITEIYAAREHDESGLSASEILRRMAHKDARFIPSLDEARIYLLQNVKPEDVVMTLGAGTVTQVAAQLTD